MKMSLIALQAAVIAAMVAAGSKAKAAETTTFALSNDELLAKASELGIDCTEIADDADADVNPDTVIGIRKPETRTITGVLRRVTVRPILDKQTKEPMLNEAGEPKNVVIADIQPVIGNMITVFMQPKQLTGFDLNVGKTVKVDYEVRKAHITQYTVTATGEVKYHGRPDDPKGKEENGFITGTEYSAGAAAREAVFALPLDERSSAIQAILAFKDFD